MLSLRLTHPLNNKHERAIDAVDDVLAKGKFKHIGSMKLKTPEEAMYKLQNDLYSHGHPLNARSMMIGDVVVCGNSGKIAEDDEVGWSGLSCDQIRKFKEVS